MVSPVYPIGRGSFPKIEGERLEELRREWDKPLAELALLFGVCAKTISTTGRRHGFPPRPPRGRREGDDGIFRGRPPALQGEVIGRLRRDWHMPMRFLVERYKVSKDTIIGTGRRHGFPPRPLEQRRTDEIMAEMEVTLKRRCWYCAAIFQGEACPNGHPR